MLLPSRSLQYLILRVNVDSLLVHEKPENIEGSRGSRGYTKPEGIFILSLRVRGRRVKWPRAQRAVTPASQVQSFLLRTSGGGLVRLCAQLDFALTPSSFIEYNAYTHTLALTH